MTNDKAQIDREENQNIEDTEELNGYQLVELNDEGFYDAGTNTSDEEGENTENNDLQQEFFENADFEYQQFEQPEEEKDTFTPEHIETIKECMKKITLSWKPAWVDVIPEEEWLHPFLDQLRQENTEGFTNESKRINE